jgi:integrase
MPRKQRWLPSRVIAEDREAASALVAAWGDPNSGTQERIRRYVSDFLRLHQEEDDIFVLMAGQMIRSGLKFSTICTYLQYCKPLLTSWSPTVRASYRSTLRMTHLAHADEDTKQIKDIDLHEAMAFVRASKGTLKHFAYILGLTGARARDLSRLRRKQIKVTNTGIRIEFRVMKNRRKRTMRAAVFFKYRDFFPASPRTLKFLKEGDKEQLLFGNWNATSFNNKSKLMNNLSSYITTKAFRRMFINRTFERLKDIEKVKTYTLHISSRTIEAFYLKGHSVPESQE